MASINKCILIGHIGRDAEVRYTPNGSAVCNLSLATTRSWKSKDSGERQEETEWHRVVLFDRLAEVAGEYLKKGRQVYIEGRLRTRKWTDKDGVEKYTTEIYGEQLQLLGSGQSSGNEGSNDDDATQSREPARRAPAPTSGGSAPNSYANAKAGRKPPPPRSGTGFDDMPDDLPF